jgi:hypothetical protein
MTTKITCDRHPRTSPHTCCGARISIGAYGDWHLCEACETHLAHRHAARQGAAIACEAARRAGIDRFDSFVPPAVLQHRAALRAGARP